MPSTSTPRRRYYLGLAVRPFGNIREVFPCAYTPTWDTHGSVYNAVVGPFVTKRGAIFMRDFGRSNPHCQNVADAERIALEYGDKRMIDGCFPNTASL